MWTWTAVCGDTGLVLSWLAGDRSRATAAVLVQDVCRRLADTVRLVEAESGLCLEAIQAVPARVGDAGATDGGTGRDGGGGAAALANRARHAGMRRFDDYAGALRGKVERHGAVLGLQFMDHNFCRVDSSEMRTPAMRAGLTDRLWETGDLAKLVEEWRARRRARRRSRPVR